jgi:hypothetical protein
MDVPIGKLKILAFLRTKLAVLGVVYYGDVDHPVPGQIDHWVS